MPKIHQHDDTKIDAELAGLWDKADKFIDSPITPKEPRPGTYWFNPSNSKLKIFINIQQGWASIN